MKMKSIVLTKDVGGEMIYTHTFAVGATQLIVFLNQELPPIFDRTAPNMTDQFQESLQYTPQQSWTTEENGRTRFK